jgi:hypothetical protein
MPGRQLDYRSGCLGRLSFRSVPQPQQPRLLFVDEKQAELWSRLSLKQQELCRNLISQLLRQIVSHQNNAIADERSSHE